MVASPPATRRRRPAHSLVLQVGEDVLMILFGALLTAFQPSNIGMAVDRDLRGTCGQARFRKMMLQMLFTAVSMLCAMAKRPKLLTFMLPSASTDSRFLADVDRSRPLPLA